MKWHGMGMAVLATLLPVTAWGASVAGQVTDGVNGISNAEVRLWVRTDKGYSLLGTGAAVTTTDGTGAYAFTGVTAGSYRLDVRGPPADNWCDRWLDAMAPMSSGYVEDDADVLSLADNTDLTGVNVALEVCGGADGLVTEMGALTAGIQVRAERRLDPRIHHNDLSQDTYHQGEFHLRGLPPAGYRVLAHDPNAVQADAIIPTPVDVAASTNVPDLMLPMMPAALDPHEPNDTMATAVMVDAGLFQQDPPLAFTTVGARIAPRNGGDVDWYCYEARPADRFKVAARGVLLLEDGTVRESPWVDPVIALWIPDGDGGMRLGFQDDDNGPGRADALVDTGELAQGGQHCVAVTTYGDTAFNGTTQNNAGDYELRIQMGNRGPLFQANLVGTDGGIPWPTPPATLNILEGDTVTIALAFSDPDHDTLNATWNMLNAMGAPDTAGSFDTSTGVATFTWTANQTAARRSPYALSLTVADAEFTRHANITIHVAAVNITPGLPTPLTPADGATVATHDPLLVCAESYDPDMQTLSYEVEVYFEDGGVPARTGTANGVAGGWDPDGGAAPTLQWHTTGFPENTHARWRVRAFDGDPVNGHSAWTAFSNFFVDVMNDPPPAPFLSKPTNGEMVMLVRPTLSVVTPVDPEGDAVTVTFEVASDMGFTTGVLTSQPVPAASGATTMWTVGQDLVWGSTYFARAHAQDIRGGVSAQSNINRFIIQPNQRPSTPSFITPPTTMCGGGILMTAPTQVVVGPSADPEMDAITIELQVFAGNVDPDTTTPALSLTHPQGAGSTTFDVTPVAFTDTLPYRFRVRASDPTGPSPWGDCRVVYDTGASHSSSSMSGMSSSGGFSGSNGGVSQIGSSGGIIVIPDAGVGTNGTVDDSNPSKGCGCRSVDGPPMQWWLILAAWVAWRRKR